MKNQKQRIKPMSKEKLSTDNLPPEQKESPEAWARLRKHLEAGDWTKCEADLTAMGLSPKLKNLFATAVAEERELGEIEAAGEGMAEKFETLSAKLRYLLTVTPKDISEVEKIGDKISELRIECNSALVARDAARRAQKMRRHLHNWVGELFGLEPINGEHSGHLSGGVLPTKTYAAAVAIKGQRRIDLYVANSWRDFDLPAGETPRRKYSTFAPSNPLFQKGTN
jgi:hypothetical protein